MKYELQFTVKTDAVKQNRKLPEIAFFDTDGNPISFGGGGSVDVSGLLPRDGSRAMTGPLEFSNGEEDLSPWFISRQDIWDALDYIPLVINNPSGIELDFVGTGGVAFSHIDDPSEMPAGHPASAFISQGAISLYGAGLGGPNSILNHGYLYIGGTEPGEFDHQTIIVQAVGDMNRRWAMDVNGKQSWGDGTNPTDVFLARVDASGDLGASNLQLDGPMVINDPDDNGLFIVDLSDSNFWNNYANVSLGGYNTWWQGKGSSNLGAIYLEFELHGTGLPDGDGFGGPTSPMLLSYGLDDAYWTMLHNGQMSWWAPGSGFNPDSQELAPHFRIDPDGALHWGDGSAAPDTHLYRPLASDADFGWLDGLKLDSGGFIISDDNANGIYVMDPRGVTPWDTFANLWVNATPGSDTSYLTLFTTSNGQVQIGARDGEGAGLNFKRVGDSAFAFAALLDGSLHWGPGGVDALDTTLQRFATGVLEIPNHGGGFKLWNDDGTVSKTVRLNHAGDALELV